MSEPRANIPWIISVDDHVLEPPNVWVDRLPAEYRDRGPRVIRERGRATDGRGKVWQRDPEGQWADVWYYDDLVIPVTNAFAAAGTASTTTAEYTYSVTTYDELRQGAFLQKERLADMDIGHTEVSACFPNVLTRFCGQTFLERDDKVLGLLCVKAYNDWVIDEWCGGDGKGRLIPITIVPLWDAQLAADEVRRCADKGSRAVSFPEKPSNLGLPTWYSREWDPFFQACEDTETTVCMHIGASGLGVTTPDAPDGAWQVLTFQYGMHSLIDTIFSGLYVRFPTLKVMYSEGNVGWMPYVLERMDKVWSQRASDVTGVDLPQPPSSFVHDRIYGCILDDDIGLASRQWIGMGQICYEVDFPHYASFWPAAEEVAQNLVEKAGLNDDEIYKFVRGNAIKAFRLEHFGITA